MLAAELRLAGVWPLVLERKPQRRDIPRCPLLRISADRQPRFEGSTCSPRENAPSRPWPRPPG
ncbi:hypothetical protein E1292_17380 [Nonomuraea deserti]|uniref:Uncharacterized protein n=1 Tax=Nonomuraea deserti TaxID=1848322 RepID=A0A4R4VMT4_9ACTN|nr:hypothetical protein E1292_17380 [Nonomuraea deserti]